MRFSKEPKHYKRPENIVFAEVKKAIESNLSLMYSIFQMENTGGEPDVIEVTEDAFIFADCSQETPDRRDLTYHEAAQMADSCGVEMMPHDIYMKMQESGEIDPTTWSWLKTPGDILKSERALFGIRENEDVMMNDVCVRYHYAARGWRGILRVPKVK